MAGVLAVVAVAAVLAPAAWSPAPSAAGTATGVPAPFTAAADRPPAQAVPKSAPGVPERAVGQGEVPAASARKPAGKKAKDADVPGGFKTWAQLLRTQKRMNETADALEDVTGQKKGQGFAGVIAAPEKRRLVLYWKGEVPPAAKAAIKASAVPVVVKKASHTSKELSGATSRMAQVADRAGVVLTDVIEPQDGSGLRASVKGGEAEASRLRRAVIAADLDVPVTVAGGGELHTLLSREHDPSFGGAQMVSPVCSTAFAINFAGRHSMMSADHCFPIKLGDERHSVGPDGQPASTSFGKRVSPRSQSIEVDIDVAALDQAPGTQYQPWIWSGRRAGVPGAQNEALVAGASRPRLDNFVCQSGARSGEICDLKVTDEIGLYQARVTDGKGGTVLRFFRNGWQAKKPRGSADSVAARHGDSGGPVVHGSQGHGIGYSTYAAGVVSAGGGTGFSCETAGGGTTHCYKSLIFVGIDAALKGLDAVRPPGVPPTELIVADPMDPQRWSYVSFPDSGSPHTTMPIQPEEHERFQVVSEFGLAVGYDTTKDGFDAVLWGTENADWEMRRAMGGGWNFLNVSDPSHLFGPKDKSGYRLAPVGGEFFELRNNSDGCVTVSMQGVIDRVGAVSTSSCLPGGQGQRFRLAPIANAVGGPLVPAPGGEHPKAPAMKPTPGPGLAVMPLGDSITLGVGSTTRTGYRPLLARRLADTTDKLRFVGSMRDADGTRHEGHSGWRIDQLQANIGPWMTEAKPNVVLLHIGTNDMDRDHQVSTAPQRLGALIDQIHTASPNTAVVVASLVPATEPAVQARVTAYNRAIPGIVADRAAKGYRITQVSMDALTTADLDDKLHPNNSGYQKMAESFLGGIATLSRNGWISEKIDVKPLPPQQPTTAGDYDVDIDGDGRADYLVVDDNGAVRAYTNTARADGTVKWTDQGYIASGSSAWTGSQVRFADVAGDDRADYLVVEPNGATRAFVNQGGDGRGGWRYQGYIASGSTAWTSDQVRFADIGGDDRADYLVVEPNGATRAFLTTTNAATGAVKMTDQGVIASGSAAWSGDRIRFADVGGDARADYLIVEPNGATRAFVNTGGNGRGGWDDQGLIATGSTAWSGDKVRFADVNGDNRADYLIVEPNGAIRAFTHTNPPTGPAKWTDQGVIATGTGAPSSRIRI